MQSISYIHVYSVKMTSIVTLANRRRDALLAVYTMQQKKKKLISASRFPRIPVHFTDSFIAICQPGALVCSMALHSVA